MKPRDFFLNKDYMKNAVIEEHQLKGITPEMVDWWWGHIDNSERYKLWHPRDHVSFRWLVPPTRESYIGAVQRVEEYIGGHLVTVRIRWEDSRDVPAEYDHVLVASILDDKGEMIRSFKHEYEKTPYGVRMRSTFPLTPDTPKWRAQGLPAHNREEMQRFPEFLPDLYRQEVLTRREQQIERQRACQTARKEKKHEFGIQRRTEGDDMAASVSLRKETGIAEVLLNRPEAFNAFDQEMVVFLAETLTHLATDDSVSAVVISGEGKAFCAGGDLRSLLALPRGPAVGLYELAASFHLAIVEIRRMKKPVIAAINGIAAGGGFSMALSCDFRVMAQSAVLRQAYTSNGLSVDGGGTFTLPRIVGLARALEIIAFDKPISSEQALTWGLVTKVVPDGQALQEAHRMALELARGSLHSFGRCKELMTNSFHTAFEAQLELERAALSRCADHPDGKEGLKAFVEKRKPVFAGGKN